MSRKERQDATVAALVKIARAMQRGTIPADRMNSGSTSIDVDLFTHGSSPETLAWYEKGFPGGEHRVYQRATFRTRRRSHQHRAPVWDRWVYVVELGTYRFLSVYYSRPHECVTFKAFSEDVKLTGNTATDYPRWYCRDCGKDMTITEARFRGLLPPLQRKAAR